MPLSEMFGTFALSVGAAVSILFFIEVCNKIVFFACIIFFMLNRIGYSLILGGYGVLGKMGSQSSVARFVMAHARGNLHPNSDAYYLSF